jgi:hypothetical protein
MAKHYSPRKNKARKKSKRGGRRGIGARGIGATGDRGAYDLCAPAWAAILIGGLAAYGTVKALGR